MTFKAVDAFCGAGGLTLGLSEAGFDVIVSFDIDPICIKTLRSNSSENKQIVIQSDVKDMLNGRLLSIMDLEKGELDLLAGGPPCQGFSIQRTIGIDEDDRNLLVNDYGDLILEVEPRFFLVENVPGIGGRRGREVLALFSNRMEDAGYALHERVLDAKDFGVPQRRKRYLLIGERLSGSAEPNFEWPEAMTGKAPTVRQTIGDLPSPPTDGSEHPSILNHRADRLSPLNKARLMSLKPGEGRTNLPPELLAKCHERSADLVGHRNVYGRMDWDSVAPTITARFDSFTRGQFGHPSETRSVSLREGARLQTFPDTYHFSGTKVEVASQIGNAIPPRFARIIGQQIAIALRQKSLTNR